MNEQVRKMEREAEAFAKANPGTIMRIERAYHEGQEAIRRKPRYSPSNPYDQETEPEMYSAWESGATDAGWNEIYTNGILNRNG